MAGPFTGVIDFVLLTAFWLIVAGWLAVLAFRMTRKGRS